MGGAPDLKWPTSSRGTAFGRQRHYGIVPFAEGGLVEVERPLDQQTRFAFMDAEPENDVPPGSLPEEVEDDVNIAVSGGEYIVPADVLRYYGVSYFEKLREKAKNALASMEEDGRMGGESFAEGGVVPGTTPVPFTPIQRPGESYFGMTEGVTQRARNVVVKQYKNPATGDTISIEFVNGIPQTPIPDFYVEVVEVAGESPPPVLPGLDPQSIINDSSSAGGEKWNELAAWSKLDEEEDKEGIDPEDNLFNKTNEELVGLGAKKKGGFFGDGKGAKAGAIVAGALAGGVGMGVVGAVTNINKGRTIAEMRAGARVLEARGEIDSAATLREQADELVENGSGILGFGERLGLLSGDNIFNRHKKSKEAVGTAPAVTPTAAAGLTVDKSKPSGGIGGVTPTGSKYNGPKGSPTKSTGGGGGSANGVGTNTNTSNTGGGGPSSTPKTKLGSFFSKLGGGSGNTKSSGGYDVKSEDW